MKILDILVVEDDRTNRDMVTAAFEEDGHTVRTAASIGDCWKELDAKKPDIVLLDRGLPDGDGLQLCLNLKKDPVLKFVPVLIFTGRSEVTDKILGLRFGADDYLAKPYDIEELRARVDAIIRRIHGDLSNKMTRGGLTMDIKARTVTLEGRPVELTNKEFGLLRLFMENSGAVLTRDSIISAVWAGAAPSSHKVVDVTVMNLRRKLGGEASPIQAVRSHGYRFNTGEAAD